MDKNNGNSWATILTQVIVLAREDVKVHLHAPQTKNEHLWLCVWVNRHLEKLHHCYETTPGP
jgi:hypothetical protein